MSCEEIEKIDGERERRETRGKEDNEHRQKNEKGLTNRYTKLH